MLTKPVVYGALAFLIGCNPFHHNAAVEVDPKLAATQGTRWNATLTTPSDLAGAVQIHGSAIMAPGTGESSTRITLNLSNASPGGRHPWEVRSGQCGGADQGVFGPSNAYKVIEIGSDGKATASATIPVAPPQYGNYFVEIRASQENPETIVACGNLAPPVN